LARKKEQAMRQFAVIGLGRFGGNIAKTLAEKKCQVMAIDRDEGKVNDFQNLVSQAVCADATDIKVLQDTGVKEVDVAIVSVGSSIEASILITLALKELGVKKVIAKAITDEHGEILEKIGADRIIFPEKETGIKLADSLAEE
jgi:trk system potassium uptake protein TrkA